MGTGQDLYTKARTLIPGGNQLLSKRPEMFLPEQWPAYYSKSKGVEVWDMDGNKFIDATYCGVGAPILGFADPDVEQAVVDAVRAGTTTTLNCPEEVELEEQGNSTPRAEGQGGIVTVYSDRTVMVQ